VQIRQAGLESVKIRSASELVASFYLLVYNPSALGFKITDIQGYVKRKNDSVALLKLLSPFSISRKGESRPVVKIAVRFFDPLGLLISGKGKDILECEDYVVDACIRFRKGPVVKKYRMRNVPLKDFMNGMERMLKKK
jgi:hypothetical protein